MKKLSCNICGNPGTERIYASASSRSLTSLCTPCEGQTQVYFCHSCGHVQSVEMPDVDGYYDRDYQILVESEEEDQVYQVLNGVITYRTEHQVQVLLDKVALPMGAKILDYGCAKSSTLRALTAKRPDLCAYLFDVSDRYLPFWKKFLPEDRWATYTLPATWDEQFDLVTSLFSLEHIVHPQQSLRQISRVLKTGATLYGIVPNVFTNTADMIVADHVNHFTAASLNHLLANNHFDNIVIDAQSHRGALVFTARKSFPYTPSPGFPDAGEISHTFFAAEKIARYWHDTAIRIREFEASLEKQRVAIYGAGFYGAFIFSCLQHPERINCFIDQNPFLHGRKAFGLAIIAPGELQDEISVIMTGLNPAHAGRQIAGIPEFKNKPLTYFYL